MADDVIAKWAERLREVYLTRRDAVRMAMRKPGVEIRWFRDLAAFVVEERVPAPLTYAAWLAAARVRAYSWCDRATLRAYLRDLPRFESRADAMRRLRDFASAWCEEHGIAEEDPVRAFATRVDIRELGQYVAQGHVPPRALAAHPAGRSRFARLPDDVRVILEDLYGVEEVDRWIEAGRGIGIGPEGGRRYER